MGRPSKLTPEQWLEIQRRFERGESLNKLAKEFRISAPSIHAMIGKQANRVKEVAKMIVEAEEAVSTLPPADQVSARNLADDLKAISHNFASAAKYGSMTSHRLAMLAQQQSVKVDDVDPLESGKNLAAIAALTKLANESSHIGMGLLKANNDLVEKLNKDAQDKPAPKQIVFRTIDGRKTPADANG